LELYCNISDVSSFDPKKFSRVLHTFEEEFELIIPIRWTFPSTAENEVKGNEGHPEGD
jgi:hypothetical protein